jgi:glycosyltransferase involved in cell wall biosynthesis
LTVSEAFAKIYRQNGFFQTQTNRNGIMPKPRLPRKPNPSQRVRLAHIGGISTHKGYYLMKEALEKAEPKNLELIVVDHAQMSGTLRREQWGDIPVTFLPKTHQDQMHEFYSTIDVLMAPSIWPESFGLVTREAVAAGVWVVASNKGAIAEDLVPGVNGDVVDPENIEELVEVLKQIDRKPQLFRQPVEQSITPRTTSDQVVELLSFYNSSLS